MKMRSYTDDLPEEIIVDIFSRLPAKSVGRCRCVSNPWRALLSKPNFIRTHLHRTRNIRGESLILTSFYPSYVFYTSLSKARLLFNEITISAKELSSTLRNGSSVFGSCDGLLLVGNCNGKKFLLNPVTKETKRVPSSPFSRDSGNLCGFGYDSVGDDYKIVTISYNYDIDTDHECGYTRKEDDEPCCAHMFVEVYSLKSDSWRRIESPPYNNAPSPYGLGVFVNGCIHWVAERTTDSKFVIVALDLAEEKFREVPAPSSVDINEFLCAPLAVLDGCLCIFEEYGTVVWVMKEYGIAESWRKLTIDGPEAYLTMPVCMFGPEQVVFLKYDVLAMYNLKEGTLKNIVIHGVPDDLRVRVSFVESLVSPHGTNPTGKKD